MKVSLLYTCKPFFSISRRVKLVGSERNHAVFHPIIMPCSISTLFFQRAAQQRLLEHPSLRNTTIQDVAISPLNHRPHRPLFPLNAIQQSALSKSILTTEVDHGSFSPRPINDASSLCAVSPSTLRLGQQTFARESRTRIRNVVTSRGACSGRTRGGRSSCRSSRA